MIYLSNITSTHGFDAVIMIYNTAGLDAKIVDTDGVIHSSRLQAEFINHVSQITIVLPLEGWTSSLQQLPPFNYGCLFALLVPDLMTIAASTAAATFVAGAMKHKEVGHHLFHNDNVWMVGNPSGFATDSHWLFHGIVKHPSKTTGSYSTVVALSKISRKVIGAQFNYKAGTGGCCKHVAAFLYNILDYVEFGLANIPEHKTCTDTTPQWNRPRNIPGDGPILFYEIPFVHHSYGKCKAEVAAPRLDKYKTALYQSPYQPLPHHQIQDHTIVLFSCRIYASI